MKAKQNNSNEVFLKSLTKNPLNYSIIKKYLSCLSQKSEADIKGNEVEYQIYQQKIINLSKALIEIEKTNRINFMNLIIGLSTEFELVCSNFLKSQIEEHSSQASQYFTKDNINFVWNTLNIIKELIIRGNYLCEIIISANFRIFIESLARFHKQLQKLTTISPVSKIKNPSNLPSNSLVLPSGINFYKIADFCYEFLAWMSLNFSQSNYGQQLKLTSSYKLSFERVPFQKEVINKISSKGYRYFNPEDIKLYRSKIVQFTTARGDEKIIQALGRQSRKTSLISPSLQIMFKSLVNFFIHFFKESLHVILAYQSFFFNLLRTRDVICIFVMFEVFLYEDKYFNEQNTKAMAKQMMGFWLKLIMVGDIQLILKINESVLMKMFLWIFDKKQHIEEDNSVSLNLSLHTHINSNTQKFFITFLNILQYFSQSLNLSTQLHEIIFEKIQEIYSESEIEKILNEFVSAFDDEKLIDFNAYCQDINIKIIDPLNIYNDEKFKYFSFNPKQFIHIHQIKNVNLRRRRQNRTNQKTINNNIPTLMFNSNYKEKQKIKVFELSYGNYPENDQIQEQNSQNNDYEVGIEDSWRSRHYILQNSRYSNNITHKSVSDNEIYNLGQLMKQQSNNQKKPINLSNHASEFEYNSEIIQNQEKFLMKQYKIKEQIKEIEASILSKLINWVKYIYKINKNSPQQKSIKHNERNDKKLRQLYPYQKINTRNDQENQQSILDPSLSSVSSVTSQKMKSYFKNKMLKVRSLHKDSNIESRSKFSSPLLQSANVLQNHSSQQTGEFVNINHYPAERQTLKSIQSIKSDEQTNKDIRQMQSIYMKKPSKKSNNFFTEEEEKYLVNLLDKKDEITNKKRLEPQKVNQLLNSISQKNNHLKRKLKFGSSPRNLKTPLRLDINYQLNPSNLLLNSNMNSSYESNKDNDCINGMQRNKISPKIYHQLSPDYQHLNSKPRTLKSPFSITADSPSIHQKLKNQSKEKGSGLFSMKSPNKAPQILLPETYENLLSRSNLSIKKSSQSRSHQFRLKQSLSTTKRYSLSPFFDQLFPTHKIKLSKKLLLNTNNLQIGIIKKRIANESQQIKSLSFKNHFFTTIDAFITIKSKPDHQKCLYYDQTSPNHLNSWLNLKQINISLLKKQIYKLPTQSLAQTPILTPKSSPSDNNIQMTSLYTKTFKIQQNSKSSLDLQYILPEVIIIEYLKSHQQLKNKHQNDRSLYSQQLVMKIEYNNKNLEKNKAFSLSNPNFYGSPNFCEELVVYDNIKIKELKKKTKNICFNSFVLQKKQDLENVLGKFKQLNFREEL